MKNVVKQTKTNGEEYNNNYVAVLPMTFEERYHMYMRCKKEELAKMLAQRDEYENLFRIPYQQPYPSYPQYPSDPVSPYVPWATYGVEGYTADDEHTSISE